jgi:tetratricopeptide (TPR) repeat protein
MQLPDWRTLGLKDGVVAEPTPGRDQLVLWIRGNRGRGFQEWERIGTAVRPMISLEGGVCRVPATSVSVRGRRHGFFRSLLQGFRRSSSKGQRWLLPNGSTAEQCGERRTDVSLAWTDGDGTQLTESAIKSRFGDQTRCRELGNNLFIVYGVERAEESGSAAPLPTGTPFAMAERALQEARKLGDQRKLVAALTDLGVLHSNEGKCQRAIQLLEEALKIARQTRDRSQETDVIGNLGMALIAKDPNRALELLRQELAITREIGSRFAEKSALNHLGIFFLRARDAAQALAHLEQALRIAHQLGDRQHEADLLWLLAIVHSETGRQEPALANAQAAVEMLETMGKPQSAVLADHLRKYREGGASLATREVGGAELHGMLGHFGDESIVAANWATATSQSSHPAANSPSWLRMGFTAAKAMARFLGSGMQRVPTATYEQRRRICLSCEHHTGLRCKLCGCFTSMKAWLPHEECPTAKWPSTVMRQHPS